MYKATTAPTRRPTAHSDKVVDTPEIKCVVASPPFVDAP